MGITKQNATTRMTVKGQVTVPKRIRDAAGIVAGDEVEVRLNAQGEVVIGKPRREAELLKRIYEVASRRVIRGATTEQIMEMTRGKLNPRTGERE